MTAATASKEQVHPGCRDVGVVYRAKADRWKASLITDVMV